MADVSITPPFNFGGLLASAGVDQQQTAASTNLTNNQIPIAQQQARGLGLDNTIKAIGLKYMLGQMNGGGMNVTSPFDASQSTTNGQADQSGEATDPKEAMKGKLESTMYSQFQPPIWTPQNAAQMAAYQQQDDINKKFGFPTNKAAAYKSIFDSEGTRRQTIAGQEYDALNAASQYGYRGLEPFNLTAPGPDGKPIPLVAALQKAGFSDDDVKEFATHLAPGAFQFSGRQGTYENGTLMYRGQPVPGADRIKMSYTDAYKQADSPATWFNGSNQKVEGTLSQKLGYDRNEYARSLMNGNESPPPKPGSPAFMEAQRSQVQSQGKKIPAAPGVLNGNQGSPLLDASTKQPIDTTGLSPQQISVIRQSKYSPGAVAPGGGADLNDNQKDAYRQWTSDAAKLGQANTTATAQATNQLTDIQRMSSTIDAAPNLGPGAKELSSFETFLHQYFGTSANKATANQILTKVIGADQLNRILATFHTEGAQVRLGAYETRIIMENLAANPAMTKEAIQQLLKWEGSDAQYNIGKLKTEAAAIQNGRDPNWFGGKYEQTIPRNQNVDTSLSAFKNKVDISKISMPIETKEEYDAMPHGQHYTWKNGKDKIKP